MVNCKFADPKIQSEDQVLLDETTGKPFMAYGFVKCLKLSEACGFAASVQTLTCNQCDCRLPADSKEDGKSCLESEFMRRIYKSVLSGRSVSGPLPKYEDPEHPFDAKAAFAKYAEISTKDEQGLLIKQMFNTQRLVPPDDGGLDPAVLARTLTDIAEEYAILPALEQAYDVLMAANQAVLIEETPPVQGTSPNEAVIRAAFEKFMTESEPV